MKTIEEKARRYDEAIKKLRSLHDNYDTVSTLIDIKEELEDIFPELAESVDERIRKEIIDFVKSRGGFKGDWIAWLEKQGEHTNFRNKIQVGDKVTRNEDGVLVNLSQLNRVAKKQGEQKPYGQRQECVDCQFNYAGECKGSCAMKRGEQKLNVNDNAKEMFIKALERVEEQNAKGYKLTDCDKNSWWEDFKAYTSCIVEQKPWSEEDEEIYRKCICAMRASACGFPEEEKFVEQVDNWLKSLKGRIQPQKQEWSEEDEAVLDALTRRLEGEDIHVSTHLAVKCLKSLKERYTWKPSDWQKEALNDVISSRDIRYDVLSELWKDLNKLK